MIGFSQARIVKRIGEKRMRVIFLLAIVTCLIPPVVIGAIAKTVNVQSVPDRQVPGRSISPDTTKSHTSAPANRLGDERDSGVGFLVMVATCVIAAAAVIQLVVVSVQAIIMYKQTRCLRDSVEATKIAAKAADKSAKALPTIERARIFVDLDAKAGAEGRITTGNPFQGKHFRQDLNTTIFILNQGKTSALIDSVFMDGGAYPTYPDAPEMDAENLRNTAYVAPGERDSICKTFKVSSLEWEQIIDGKLKLLCYGRVAYRDVFGANHVTCFCYEYTQRGFLQTSFNDPLNSLT